MKREGTAFFCGALFAAGLCISGMTQPGKVTAFLDFTGNWDPSLAFVMMGALLVYGIGSWLVLRRPAPMLDACFHVPTRRDIDGRVITGAGLFGMGWGLAGFCPGPALVSLSSLTKKPLVFTAAMLVGMGVFHFWNKKKV